MRFSIIYGTTEGQTRKIVERMATCIREHGPDVDIVESTALPEDLDLGSSDAIIVAASVHQHRHQSSIVHFVKDNLEALKAKPSAFVSVSLAAAFEDERADAQEYVDKFLDETGWQPTETYLVEGALLYTQYDFFKRQMMKLIVWTGGGPTETNHDHEFTDWDALSKFVDGFLEKVSG